MGEDINVDVELEKIRKRTQEKLDKNDAGLFQDILSRERERRNSTKFLDLAKIEGRAKLDKQKRKELDEQRRNKTKGGSGRQKANYKRLSRNSIAQSMKSMRCLMRRTSTAERAELRFQRLTRL